MERCTSRQDGKRIALIRATAIMTASVMLLLATNGVAAAASTTAAGSATTRATTSATRAAHWPFWAIAATAILSKSPNPYVRYAAKSLSGIRGVCNYTHILPHWICRHF
jgi:hypothetical protein